MEDEVKITKKKKAKYSPYKVSIIILVGLFIMIIILNMYNNKNMRYAWLVCTLNTEEKEFNETIKFKFIEKNKGELIEYYRDELYTYDNPEEYDKIYERLVDYRESFGEYFSGDNIQYKIKKKSDSEITVSTYINVNTYGTLFDQYIEAFDLDQNSDIEDIYNTFAANNTYSCKMTESRS